MLLQQIIAGLEAGSSYSLLGLSIVIVMKSTDVPNFAAAEMGLVSAYLTWYLSASADNGGLGFPFILAVVVALAFAVVLGIAVQFLLVRPLTGLSGKPLAVLAGILAFLFCFKLLAVGSEATVADMFSAHGPIVIRSLMLVPSALCGLLAYFAVRQFVIPLMRIDHFPLLLLTVGLTFVLAASIQIVWGSAPHAMNAPWSAQKYSLFGASVGAGQIITICAGLVVALGVGAFFKSPWGVRMRAIAEDGQTARLLGINSGAMSMAAWAIGGVIAAIAMILNTSQTIIELGSGDILILKGFIAATLGGFTNLGGAFLGGLVLGVGETLAGSLIGTAVQPTVALLIVAVVLLASPSGLTREKKRRQV